MNIAGPVGEFGFLTITLSRRNLEGLLVQLDNVRGKEGDAAQIMRRIDGLTLLVVAEENDAHYGDRHVGVSDGSDRRSA